MPNRTLFALVLVCFVLLGGCTAAPAQDTLELHMPEVGNADCFLLKLGDKAMLIDGGEPDDADHIVSYLHTHGIERLEAIVMTHPHADHIGGLERVVTAYKPKTVYYASIPDGIEAITPMHTRLFDAICAVNAVLCEAGDGVTFALGTAQVELFQPQVNAEDANEYSLITRVTFGEERFLFMGDALEKAQKALMNSGRDLRATVLKMSHHGGKVSTTRALLDRVQPSLVLLSCGADNTYRHPHADTMTALRERGIEYCRTDVHGDTVIVFDGQGKHFITTAR